MKRTLSIFLSLTLLVFTVCPAFARGMAEVAMDFQVVAVFPVDFHQGLALYRPEVYLQVILEGCPLPPSFLLQNPHPKQSPLQDQQLPLQPLPTDI